MKLGIFHSSTRDFNKTFRRIHPENGRGIAGSSYQFGETSGTTANINL